MGHIKEPEGVHLLVEPSLLTGQERKRISEIIAHFKATGKKMAFQKTRVIQRAQKKDTFVKKTLKNIE